MAACPPPTPSPLYEEVKASLLPSTSSPPPSPAAALFTCLLLSTAAATAAAATFSFVFFFSSPSPCYAHARSLSKLSRPTVLLISADGFRYGYQHKCSTPNIHRLISNGAEAEPGLIPVFPTLTFPNHYSIATGLYPSYHGIIANQFTDPISGDTFTMSSHEPKWWQGEPLWVTVANHNLTAATYFWPGSEVHKGNWDCPPKFCNHYNGSVPFEQRVDTVLSYFDLSKDHIPVFITLYFEDPDHQGHQFGPDDIAITNAVSHIDSLIGRLIQGLEKRGIFEDVTIILLGDHGMVGTCDKKLIFIDDLSPWITIPLSWIQSYSPVLLIRPPDGVSLKDVVAKMNEGLSSEKVENGVYLKMYLKEDLPERLHYSENYRIPPIVGLVAEGYKIEKTRSNGNECGGAHGYDNLFFSMRTIFIAHGPQFERGKKIPSFENVQIYNLVTKILKLKGAPNNGSDSFANSVLLPTA